ncbi:MAG TPA: type II toxin-antitoxin system HigB family toxin, partial [Caldilineaceae bacterium]|nr:type II toxin-antitoxin system HigB family toxin [Caldilineaceae bacterium]
VELRRDFPSADQVRRLTVFDIGGNHFRLIARVEYASQRVYVRAVLTHAEYDVEKWKNDDWF